MCPCLRMEWFYQAMYRISIMAFRYIAKSLGTRMNTGFVSISSIHCPDNDFVLQYASRYLDNRIEQLDSMPDQEDSDMAKINRNITLNGKQHCIRANTEQEYVDKLARIMGTYQEPTASKVKHNFSEYAWNWYDIYSSPNIESATKLNYKRQLNKYIIPVIGDKNIEDITPEDIQKIFNSMSTAKTSKKVVKTVLNQILKSAYEDEYIVRNPLNSSKVKITGTASKPAQPYSVDQIRYLIEHIPEIRKKLDQAYIALQALHGLRLEEVLGVQWGDIDLDNRLIYIRRAATHPDRNKPVIKETKTTDSVRPIGLSALAVPYLIPGKPTDFILGGNEPLSYQQVREMCRRIRRDTGFNENITPYVFVPLP